LSKIEELEEAYLDDWEQQCRNRCRDCAVLYTDGDEWITLYIVNKNSESSFDSLRPNPVLPFSSLMNAILWRMLLYFLLVS